MKALQSFQQPPTFEVTDKTIMKLLDRELEEKLVHLFFITFKNVIVTDLTHDILMSLPWSTSTMLAIYRSQPKPHLVSAKLWGKLAKPEEYIPFLSLNCATTDLFFLFMSCSPSEDLAKTGFHAMLASRATIERSQRVLNLAQQIGFSSAFIEILAMYF